MRSSKRVPGFPCPHQLHLNSLNHNMINLIMLNGMQAKKWKLYSTEVAGAKKDRKSQYYWRRLRKANQQKEKKKCVPKSLTPVSELSLSPLTSAVDTNVPGLAHTFLFWLVSHDVLQEMKLEAISQRIFY